MMDETTQGRTWSGPNLMKLMLTLAGGALLGWLVVRTAMVGALIETDPAAAGAISPHHPAVILEQADAETRQAGGTVSDDRLKSALDASAGAPLSETPFLLAGAQALQAGDGERAEQLLSEARRRNPRSRTARFLLLEHYVRAGQVNEAATEMTVLSRLLPDARPLLIAGLARFAAHVPNPAAISQVLDNDPAVRNGVLEHLAATGASPDLILALAKGQRPPPGAEWPGRVIDALVKRGDISKAYALWRRLNGFPSVDGPTGLFNAGFEDLPASPPFNWRLASGASGLAEMSAGLHVRYPGRTNAELAAQLIRLPAGAYTLSFDAEGEDDVGGSEVRWVLSCYGSNARLLSAPVSATPVLAQSNRSNFMVPAGCGAQWIRLAGVPRQGAGMLDLTITDLELHRQDRQ